MRPSRAPKDSSPWILAAPACRELAIDIASLEKVAREAGIRVRRLPGVPARYHVDDIRAAMERAVTVG